MLVIDVYVVVAIVAVARELVSKNQSLKLNEVI